MPEEEYEFLVGEMPRNHNYQTALMITFFAVWILDSFPFRLTTLTNSLIPFWIPIFPGILVFVGGLYLMDRAHKDLLSIKEAILVTVGIYSRIRHPMYLGMVLCYYGMALASLSVASLVICIVISIAYNKFATYEEKLLEMKFGEEFLKYKNDVPKWVI